MENQIAKVDTEEDYKAVAIEYLQGMGMNLPKKHEMQFLNICQAYGLNPIKREVYAVGYGENWNIITGYEVYLKRAERTGKLDGWECHVEGKDKDMVAKITIYRKDWKMPFTHEVYYAEAVQYKKDGTVNSMWRKMPAFMLRKVAMAQGFRLAFPDELGGMPYTSDELPEIEKTTTPDFVETPKRETVIANTSEEPTESALILEQMLSQYIEKLPKKVVEMCEGALASNEGVDEMLDRLKAYLAKVGVKVA